MNTCAGTVPEFPENVGAATEPVSTAACPEKVCAGTVPGVPENVGAATEPVSTAACPEKVSAGTVPEFPVNAGAEFVPAGVIEETPPEGFAVVAETTSPDVGARTDPPVAVDVITCVPVVAAVVPPCTS